MTTGIFLSPEEMDALYAVPALAQRLYVLAIRPTMDFQTGICGKRSRISWHGLARALRVEASQGVAGELPTRNQLRRAAEWLVRVGLISLESEGRQLVVRCLAARVDSLASDKLNKVRTKDAGKSGTDVDKPAGCVDTGVGDEIGRALRVISNNAEKGKPTYLRVSEKENNSLSGADSKQFTIPWHWRPFDADQFSENCALSGVCWEALGPEVQELIRVEFVRYWMAQRSEATQAQWEHKFIGSIQYQVRRGVERLVQQGGRV